MLDYEFRAEGLYEVAKVASLNNALYDKKLLEYDGITVPYKVDTKGLNKLDILWKRLLRIQELLQEMFLW